MGFKFVNITKKIEKNAINNKLIRNLLFSYYVPIVKKEILLSPIKCTDKLLFIGGGYIPCTAILFLKYTKANITVIDNDINALDNSKKLINKLNLNNINIVHCDGLDMDFSDFSVIHIAMQVEPLTEIFNKIYNISNSKIILRKPKDKLKKGYATETLVVKPSKTIKQVCYSNIKESCLYEK